MLVAEALYGLGLTAPTGPAEFTLVGRDGGRESADRCRLLGACEPDDPPVAFEPDVPVELTSADFLAGRDPVLSAALRPAPR